MGSRSKSVANILPRQDLHVEEELGLDPMLPTRATVAKLLHKIAVLLRHKVEVPQHRLRSDLDVVERAKDRDGVRVEFEGSFAAPHHVRNLKASEALHRLDAMDEGRRTGAQHILLPHPCF